MLDVAMPYCNQCGTQVGDGDRFCGKCGATQAGARPPAGVSFDPRQAATLCYIPFIGWIVSLIVLATGSYRAHHRTVFHAFQGLYLAIAWLLVDILGSMFRFSGMMGRNAIPGLIHAVILVVWIITLIKVHQGEDPRIPIIGEIAEKSAQDHSGSRT